MNSINSSDNSSEKKQNYYLTIDEHGYILQGEKRITDSHLGKTLLENIRFAPNGAFETEHSQTQAFVEAFDEPLIAHSVSQGNDLQQWIITAPYETSFYFDISTLTVDEWDRFHGITSKGIPFVFSKKAQSQFFDLLEEFDDDSITIQGQKINIPAWLSSRKDVHSESYWSRIYQTENPGWELNQAAPALIDMLPRLKLPKSKVLILGCGTGNDAAHFAEHGHVVTAVDISPEAIQRGKEKFKHLDIRWIEADAFNLPQNWTAEFDIIFEHTCFCAIDPNQRNELIRQWCRLLAPGGYLMGVFFTMERRHNPPFGSTEWELRSRLKKYFSFVFWGRWHQSIGRRDGKELFIYAQKINS